MDLKQNASQRQRFSLHRRCEDSVKEQNMEIFKCFSASYTTTAQYKPHFTNNQCSNNENFVSSKGNFKGNNIVNFILHHKQ